MSKINIISERSYRQWASFHIVYEWEDVFAMHGIQLKTRGDNVLDKLRIILDSGIRDRLHPVFYSNRKEYNLRFVMNAAEYKAYTQVNTIPIFLDFHFSMVEEIRRATIQLPFYWVTCLDIERELIKQGANNVYFFPLSISDIYYTGNPPPKK